MKSQESFDMMEDQKDQEGSGNLKSQFYQTIDERQQNERILESEVIIENIGEK